MKTVEVTWVTKSEALIIGMIGEHEVASIVRQGKSLACRWQINVCNGFEQFHFQPAASIAEAKACVRAGVVEWFRRAGLPCDSPD